MCIVSLHFNTETGTTSENNSKLTLLITICVILCYTDRAVMAVLGLLFAISVLVIIALGILVFVLFRYVCVTSL